MVYVRSRHAALDVFGSSIARDGPFSRSTLNAVDEEKVSGAAMTDRVIASR